MYQPFQHGIKKDVRLVTYTEVDPPKQLSHIVCCYWQLKTLSFLPNDFHYHVLPDACIDIIFDYSDRNEATVMTPNTSSIVLNLGKDFNYIGVRFLPGVWNIELPDIVGSYRKILTLGDKTVSHINEELMTMNFANQQKYFSKNIESLCKQGILKSNPIIQTILTHLNKITNVADMSLITELSSRQLQRIIKKSTGFSPHDFLKILRLQQSFNDDYLSLYADQSHFIHSFRKITSYTPEKYKNTFNV